MFLVTANDNPPTDETPEDAVIMNYGLVNARCRLRAPYNKKDAYPGYCLGASPIWVECSFIAKNSHRNKKEQLLAVAACLKEQYLEQKKYPSLLSIEPEQMDLMVGQMLSGPPYASCTKSVAGLMLTSYMYFTDLQRGLGHGILEMAEARTCSPLSTSVVFRRSSRSLTFSSR